jgi:hypothetical protein
MKGARVFRALLLAAPLLASPALAKTGCTRGAVFGLDPQGSNNLAVRAAPGGALGVAAEIDQLYTGDVVCLYPRVGSWFHVSYDRNGDGRAIARSSVEGATHEGWVWYSYIAIVQTPAPSYAPPSYAPPVYAPAPSLPRYLQLIDGGNSLYAPIMLGDIPINALVDTGATHLSITELLAEQLLQSGRLRQDPTRL